MAALTPSQGDFASPQDRTLSPGTPAEYMPAILPHDRVFNIQVGCQTFQLSGASLSSDAPSYFTNYFSKQVEDARNAGDDRGCRTLHIDRDPDLFKDIAMHLQGYHIRIQDPQHFAYLFADAQLFHLPKLTSRLYESEIWISIGAKTFQIPRDLFSHPGDSPNYFTLGFTMFFSTPKQIFPGMLKEGLLRPPAIAPADIPNKSPEIFADLLHMLRGYNLEIRNETHRAALLQDCKYYHLKGLEQRVVPHAITFNPLFQREEIALRLEDIKPSGVAFALDTTPDDDLMSESGPCGTGSITYARPFVDKSHRELLVEIGNHQALIHIETKTATFVGDTDKRVKALCKIIKGKVQPTQAVAVDASALEGHPTAPSGGVKVHLDTSCYMVLDGNEYRSPLSTTLELEGVESLCVKNGIWRLRLEQNPITGWEVILHGVKIDVTSGQYAKNKDRLFLA